MATLKAFPTFHYQGTDYDLAHLNAFSCEYIQPAKANDVVEKTYHCIIEFSTHCFTRGLNQRQNESLVNIDEALHYITPKETRIFCFERYELSKKLPEIMKEVDKKKCHFTSADDKFLTVSLLDKNGKPQDYEIYFSLQKAKAKDHDVHIFINSAYIRDDNHKAPRIHGRRRKPVGFFILLHNTIAKKKIKRPK